jgi:hypothetical protein
VLTYMPLVNQVTAYMQYRQLDCQQHATVCVVPPLCHGPYRCLLVLGLQFLTAYASVSSFAARCASSLGTAVSRVYDLQGATTHRHVNYHPTPQRLNSAGTSCCTTPHLLIAHLKVGAVTQLLNHWRCHSTVASLPHLRQRCIDSKQNMLGLTAPSFPSRPPFCTSSSQPLCLPDHCCLHWVKACCPLELLQQLPQLLLSALVIQHTRQRGLLSTPAAG